MASIGVTLQQRIYYSSQVDVTRRNFGRIVAVQALAVNLLNITDYKPPEATSIFTAFPEVILIFVYT